MIDLRLGDCREVMRGMAEGSVGMTLTSPPYNVGLKYDGFDDKLTDEAHRAFSRDWLTELYRVTQDTGRLYAVVGDHMLWWFREAAELAGWHYVQRLQWCKPNMNGGARGLAFDWSFQSEDIMLFRKGARTPMQNSRINGIDTRSFNWLVDATPQTNYSEGRIHPAQMPVSLCEKIIARTPGDPVFDPFAGSGSVLVAAKRLGRAAIGVELVPSVADRARERIANTNPPLMVEVREEQAGMFQTSPAEL